MAASAVVRKEFNCAVNEAGEPWRPHLVCIYSHSLSFSAIYAPQKLLLPLETPETHPTMAEDKPNCKVILANNIAKSLMEEVRDGLSKIERKPLLVGFLSSSDPGARVYAEWTGKTCTEK
jgi:hypothetical protein